MPPARMYWIDGSRIGLYLGPMVYPFAERQHWIDVTHQELEAFLRDYPRPLEARPPLDRKANFREWVDLSLGPWPEGSVAKMWVRGSCRGQQVRAPVVAGR